MPTIDRQQAITISLRLDEKYKPKTSSENRRSYVIDDGKREIEIHYFHWRKAFHMFSWYEVFWF